MILFKRDTSDNQGELQQVPLQGLDDRTQYEPYNGTSDSQAISHGREHTITVQEHATEEQGANENLYPES